MFLSAASTNARMAEDETPCASGLLRGRSMPRQMELPSRTSAMREKVLMRVTSVGRDRVQRWQVAKVERDYLV